MVIDIAEQALGKAKELTPVQTGRLRDVAEVKTAGRLVKGIRGVPKAGENGVFYALVKEIFGMSHGGDGQK